MKEKTEKKKKQMESVLLREPDASVPELGMKHGPRTSNNHGISRRNIQSRSLESSQHMECTSSGFQMSMRHLDKLCGVIAGLAGFPEASGASRVSRRDLDRSQGPMPRIRVPCPDMG